ncbi:MAG: ABC transporter permease [Acidobacteria bacterium]|nr:ABC transporter permease [Acidobacteriota bacterium]
MLLLANRQGMVGLVLVLAFFASAIFAPWLAPYDPNALDIPVRLSGPTWDHWAGTDSLGRDQFTRLLYGARVSLGIGVSVAFLSTLIGVTVGVLAGFLGGWVESVLMRLTDIALMVPPLIFLIIGARMMQDKLSGGAIWPLIFLVTVVSWMTIARVIRGQVLALREREFVEAARALGAKKRRIIGRAILPNLIGIITVNLTIAVAGAILLESTLSFLGLGVQVPTPTWGNMLDSAKSFIETEPYLVWFPGLAIVITVLCVNFVGDGLRDALDPTQRKT